MTLPVTPQTNLKIATRKSQLALWQAKTVQSMFPYPQPELVLITTTGDKMQIGPLSNVVLDENIPAHLSTGKGLFVKEIQESLLLKQGHIAVHSMKDLPVTVTKGLVTAAVLPRASAADVLILSPQIKMDSLLDLATKIQHIGTTSARRQWLCKANFGSHITLSILRGNVDSRIKRVRNNDFGAILLAEAGLQRLELFDNSYMVTLPVETFIPAPAQGVVAIEVHEDDLHTRQFLAAHTHPESAIAAALERLVQLLLGGHCGTALGAHYNGQCINIFCTKDNLPAKFLKFKINDADRLMRNFLDCERQYNVFFDTLTHSQIATDLKKSLIQADFKTVSDIL